MKRAIPEPMNDAMVEQMDGFAAGEPYPSDLAQRLADAERALAEQGRQLAAAHARELLLERLARIQRDINRSDGLRATLDAITAGAREVIGGDVVYLVLDGDIASYAGVDPAGVELPTTISAPVLSLEQPVGMLTAGARDVGRRYTRAEHETLRSFADSAARAVGEARAVAASLQQALHDPLTGLPNRALFLDRLSHALAPRRRGVTQIGVLLIDVDRFRALNDSLGHAGGDAILREVAARLRACLRPDDTAARLGGDQFGIIVNDAAGMEEVRPVAERILAAMHASFPLGDRTAAPTASIGVALAEIGADPGEIVGDADIAMRAARLGGRGRYEVFDAGMRARRADRLELEADLHAALNEDEDSFTVLYQPIVSLADGRAAAYEALLRWEHPERGMLMPSAFIPVAEECALIVPVGRLVLRRALRDVRAWRETDPDLCISVNLSPSEFAEDALVEDVLGALREARVPPSALMLEITENAFIRDAEATIEKLWALRAVGVRIAIDDFGTGYSSLAYLRRFPVDMIKIDKSFIDGVAGGDDEAAFARAIVKLGHMLRLQIVAEGIETDDQLERLRSLRVQFGQGFLLSMPMARDEVDARLATTERHRQLSAG